MFIPYGWLSYLSFVQEIRLYIEILANSTCPYITLDSLNFVQYGCCSCSDPWWVRSWSNWGFGVKVCKRTSSVRCLGRQGKIKTNHLLNILFLSFYIILIFFSSHFWNSKFVNGITSFECIVMPISWVKLDWLTVAHPYVKVTLR